MPDNTLASVSSFSVEQLRYLVEVAARPSFRSAANHLHLSPGALTRQMGNLEDRLGVTLFHRTTSGIRLTAAGSEVHGRALQILRDIDRLREAAYDADRAVSGVISVACYPVHVERIIGRTIGTFRRQFPHVRFDLSQMRDDRRRKWGESLFEELRSGEVDLAMGPPHRQRGITGMRMYDARIVALVPDGDPYRTAGSIPIAALQGRPLLMAPEGFFSRERVSGEARTAGFEINVVAHSSSPAALLVLGRNGLGTPVLPDDYPLVGQQRFPYPVVEDAHGVPISTPVWLHWRTEELGSTVANFVNAARAEVRRESRRGRAPESYFGAELTSNNQQEEETIMEIQDLEDVEAVAKFAAEDAVKTLASAIQERGRAYWVLAGGTSPIAAYRVLAESYKTALDWSKVVVSVGDERCVPLDDPDSNWSAISTALMGDGGITGIQGLVPQAAIGAEPGAELYEALLRESLGTSLARQPDLVWLGVGEDGHTLSLFPGRSEIKERDALVLPIHNSPKPPSDRITLSLGAVGAARRAVVFAVGAAKKDALAQALSDAQSLPIGFVSAAIEEQGGDVIWLFDRAAR